MICKNCGHTLLYSDEHEFWFHERETLKWTKDQEYDVVVEDEDRRCAQGDCGCKKPVPKGKVRP